MKRGAKTVKTARTAVLTLDMRQWRTVAAHPVVAGAAFVAAGVGLLTASAWVSVPFYPVPMTMQTLAVLIVGGLLGPTLGTASVAGYLALGLAGAPVFHGGLGGPLVFMGPTGGYLLGFLPAALVMGLAAHSRWATAPGRTARARRWTALVAGALSAEAAIYAIGVPWLSLIGGMGLRNAAAVGLVPFLLGDLLKAAVAIGAVRGGRRALARWGMPSL